MPDVYSSPPSAFDAGLDDADFGGTDRQIAQLRGRDLAFGFFLARFAQGLDVITLENEFIDADLLRGLEETTPSFKPLAAAAQRARLAGFVNGCAGGIGHGLRPTCG